MTSRFDRPSPLARLAFVVGLALFAAPHARAAGTCPWDKPTTVSHDLGTVTVDGQTFNAILAGDHAGRLEDAILAGR